MDPDVALKVLRDMVSRFQNDDAWIDNDFIEHFDALDKWITSGGFLPKDWAKKRVSDNKDDDCRSPGMVREDDRETNDDL